MRGFPEQRYLPVVGAARAPNMIRSVETWLGKSGLNVAYKGPLFEAHCRTRLRNAFREAPILRRAGVLGRSIDVGGDQIDLLFWIGSTIVVGELKARSDAAEAFEFRTTLDDIDTAARQATRKAEAVRLRPDEVRRAIEVEHGVTIDVAHVLPVIVTTLPVWTGLVWDEVPVADILVLQTFIGRPTLSRWVTIDERGRELSTSAEPIVLYTSEDEAEERLWRYLLDPPLFREYWKHLGREDNVLPPLTDGHRPIVART